MSETPKINTGGETGGLTVAIVLTGFITYMICEFL